MKKFTFILIILLGTSALKAQTKKSWILTSEKEINITGERVIIPQKYQIVHLENGNFKNVLFSAPKEEDIMLKSSQIVIDLPVPNGSFQRFKVVAYSMIAPELASQFPTIKTFNLIGIDEPGIYGKLDWTEFGLHVMLKTKEGAVFMDPYCRNNVDDYIVYYAHDFQKDPSKILPEIGVIEKNNKKNETVNSRSLSQICAGSNLRKYRFAVSCTGEYAQAATGFSNPTTAQILSAVTTTVNRVNGVYETEVAVRLTLVANETSILYGNPSTDPFTGNNNGGVLINESQTVITSVIGSANFDIGHTFSTGGGGLAGLGVVCDDNRKAIGITGSPNPVGDPYDIDYVAHEVGHQFAGHHTFSAATGSCGGNYNPGTMVEPGSGVTIMAYAGICSSNDIAANSIAYFHTISFDEIMEFTTNDIGSSCPVITSTVNSAPIVTAPTSFTIPKSTPFALTGSATDLDGDVLTYSWEEFDNNSTPHNLGTGAIPFFRSYAPTSSPIRLFPLLATILTGGTSSLGNYLPATPQTLNFRLTARDNKVGGGGVCYDNTQVIVASLGPFEVTYPNATGITWASNSTQTITWNVNSTDVAPVSCSNVNILLSTDGGNTFTTVLANTPNDGSQSITVPVQSVTKTTCRIKVECEGNIFFDISNNNFTITLGTGPLPPVAAFAADNTSPCIGSIVNFTDQSTGSTTSWAWSFNPTSITYTGGTTAASKNPKVQFNAIGPYTVTLVATNGSGSDSEIKTNYITPLTGASLPFTENFESTTFPPTGWIVQNPDAPSIIWGTIGDKGLERRTALGNTGSTAGCVGFNCYAYPDTLAQIDNLISKTISLVGASAPKMSFKRAYKYYNDVAEPFNFHDELKIYVSTDCGTTYGSAIYFKKGAELASNGTSNSDFIPADTADWQTDTVNLSSYVGQNVTIKFEVGNRYGNNLYLDDINVYSSSLAAAVSIALTSGSNPSCAGSSLTFTATPTNGGTAPTYQWKVNGNNVGTGSTYTTSALTNGQIVTCVMTSNLPGVTSNPATSNALTITITPIPATPTAGSNSALCAGSTLNLTSNTISGATYNWSGPGAYTSTQEDPTRTNATTAMSGTYSVTATVAGCTSLAATTTVMVNPIPATPAAGSNSALCAGSTLNLTSNTISGATYNWSGPGGYTSTQEDPSRTNATTAMSGTYSVTATAAGCVSLAGTTTVLVNPTPVTPTISQTGLVLTSSSSVGNQWYLNGSVISGAVNQTYTVTQNGNYTVIVTTNCVSDTSAVITIMNVGIEQITSLDNRVAVYPNPSNGIISISFNQPTVNSSIKLFSIEGKKLMEISNITENNFEFNFTEHPTGIYFLEINLASGKQENATVIRKKLVKMN